MRVIKTHVCGRDVDLATTLRVAYQVQGQHNHKPYAAVFQGIGEMGVEQQIDILYAAFECANPILKQEITKQKFRDYYLDNYNLKDLMSQLQEVVKGIMGEDALGDSGEYTEIEGEDAAEDGGEGNK